MQTFRSFSFGSERGCLQAEIHALFGNITTKAFAQFILVTSRATAHITKSLKAQGVFNDLPYSLLLASYRISSYSFRNNYYFLNLEIQRSQYIRPKVKVHKGAETIQGRKLFKGGNYMRKYNMHLVEISIFF